MRWFYDFVGRCNTGIASLKPCRAQIYAHYPVVVWICLVCEGTIFFPQKSYRMYKTFIFSEIILNRKRPKDEEHNNIFNNDLAETGFQNVDWICLAERPSCPQDEFCCMYLLNSSSYMVIALSRGLYLHRIQHIRSYFHAQSGILTQCSRSPLPYESDTSWP